MFFHRTILAIPDFEGKLRGRCSGSGSDGVRRKRMNGMFDPDSLSRIPLLEIRREALSYIRGHRLETGGFCYFKSMGSGAPSVLDTHAAALAFRLLDPGGRQNLRSDSRTHSWLMERLLLELSGEDITGVWHLCSSLRLMGDFLSEELRLRVIAFLEKTAKHFFREGILPDGPLGKTGTSGSQSSLIAWNRLADLARWNGDRPFLPVSDDPIGSTLIERFYDWEMDISGWYPGRISGSSDLSPFLHAVFGYVLSEGSTATDMAVIASGVMRDVKERKGCSFSKEILEWVMDSRSVSGGFGRIPGAIPDLLSTAQAILILELLTGEGFCFDQLLPKGLWWSLQEN